MKLKKSLLIPALFSLQALAVNIGPWDGGSTANSLTIQCEAFQGEALLDRFSLDPTQAMYASGNLAGQKHSIPVKGDGIPLEFVASAIPVRGDRSLYLEHANEADGVRLVAIVKDERSMMNGGTVFEVVGQPPPVEEENVIVENHDISAHGILKIGEPDLTLEFKAWTSSATKVNRNFSNFALVCKFQ